MEQLVMMKKIKLTSLITEDEESVLDKDVTYKSEDGKEHKIKVASALTYPKDHAAYKAAKAMTGGKDKDELEKDKKEKPKDDAPKKPEGGEKPEKPKSDAPEKSEDPNAEPKGAAMFKQGASAHDLTKKHDDHGHGDHGHHDHGPKHLGHGHRIAIAAIDIACKALHIPGLENVAGQMETIANHTSEVLKSHKEAVGFLAKAKSVGNAALGKIKNAGQTMAKDFANSLHDENTGARKSLGKVFADKGAALAKGVYNGIKGEVQHIGHGLSGGVDVAKKVLKGEKIDEEDKKKIVNCVRAVADVAIIGLAVGGAMATGGVSVAVKAASLAINPGHAIKGMITADVYSDLQRQGKIRVMKESKIRFAESYILEIQRMVETSIDELDDNKLMTILMKEGGKELQSAKDPLNTYSEEHMDMTVDYAIYANATATAKNDPKSKELLLKAAATKKKQQTESKKVRS